VEVEREIESKKAETRKERVDMNVNVNEEVGWLGREA
jgi:hypothetical protein